MWPYHPDLLAQSVPRYTSYPPATSFCASVDESAQYEALKQVASATPISLYVHIPFCQSICWYCGCNTGKAGKAQRLQSYLAALEKEIALTAKLLGGRGKVVTIAFGGGSPNALAPTDFVRLVDRIVTMFAAGNAQISIEIDPRAFTLEWAMMLAISGVTRVSFGVQSFDTEIQAAIGRIQPVEMIEMCVAALRARGVKSINFDLMYGLPNQTISKLSDTIDHVLRLAPERIALFGYAHLPAMFPRQRLIASESLPDTKARFDLAAYGFERLIDAGYQAIGFDHFAKPNDNLAKAQSEGRLRRNFQGFTDDSAEVVIGLGASAISIFPDRIIQNDKNIASYRQKCADGGLAGARGVKRDSDDQERAHIIEDILCKGEAMCGPFLSLPQVQTRLSALAQCGLVDIQDDRVVLRGDALPYARHVAAVFDSRL